MDQALKEHFDRALVEYTTGNHVTTLLTAKKEYFEMSGPVQEEDDDYEARMNSFNDWYILQYVAPDKTKTAIKEYLLKNNIDTEIREAFCNVNYSLFEYLGTNFSKQISLHDLLHDKKFSLAPGHSFPGLVKNDVFTGRVINFKGHPQLVSGLCILPREIRPQLIDQCKKIRKSKDVKQEAPFLFKVEFLKSKWKHYNHLSATKFFNLNQ
jgi:hypothetical protein